MHRIFQGFAFLLTDTTGKTIQGAQNLIIVTDTIIWKMWILKSVNKRIVLWGNYHPPLPTVGLNTTWQKLNYFSSWIISKRKIYSNRFYLEFHGPMGPLKFWGVLSPSSKSFEPLSCVLELFIFLKKEQTICTHIWYWMGYLYIWYRLFVHGVKNHYLDTHMGWAICTYFWYFLLIYNIWSDVKWIFGLI